MSLSDARTDVLVVGSGGAGMSAVLSATRAGADVIVTTKSALGAGNTGKAQGGIQAAIGDDDSVESHYEDTFAAGHHAARPELVRQLTDSGPEAIAWLDALGVGFTREEGRLRLVRCGGARRKRLLQAGERTGAEMVKAMRTAVRRAFTISAPVRSPACRRRFGLAPPQRTRRRRPSSRVKPTPSASSQAIASGPLSVSWRTSSGRAA